MNSLSKLYCIGNGNKLGISIGLISIVALMIVPSTISEAFADGESKITWQLVFIKIEECSPNDTLDEVYASLTSKYFELYQLENIAFDVNCMSESEYQDFQMNEDANLLILVYDEDMGQKILEPNNIDGVYVHNGNDRTQNHLVIMCHCSDYDTGYERTLSSSNSNRVTPN